MTNDISGFGLRARLIASRTFPAGITLTQLADDTDPLDLPEIVVAETAMGVNGDLLSWSKANPVVVVLAVIPNSEDDRNLGILLEANRVAKGKQGARDAITVTVVYPDGRTKTVSGGTITTGRPGQSVTSAGRMKSKPYTFAFEGLSGQ